MGLLFSLAGLVAGFVGGRRSVGLGLAAVLAVGYFYGILRARYLDGFSHFIFDAAVLGLYLGHFSRVHRLRPPHCEQLFQWSSALMLWPVAVFAMGILYPQHVLVQLVGLRSAVWFLPFLLLGGWSRSKDHVPVARTLAVLNGVALAFGLAEYVMGIEPFFPRNAVTEVLYRSRDVAGYSAFRIPATFSSSAAYGGVMVASLPWLIGRWASAGAGALEKSLMIAGTAAAAMGVFLCASRTPVLLLVALGLVTAYRFRARIGYLVPALAMAGLVAYFVGSSERLQRFTSLQDREMVAERLSGSTNLGMVELLLEHPLGAGLGSAFGTSIPSFLAHLAPEPIGTENEYARIGIEQSLVGLGLWVGFLAWLLCRRGAGLLSGWKTGGLLMWWSVLLGWLTALIGCGALTAIPGTPMLLFMMGVVGRPTEAAREVTPARPIEPSPQPAQPRPGRLSA
jgi:hypothetical protein